MADGHDFSVDRDELIGIAKPLFYGFTFMAGVTITVSPGYAGTLLGIAMIAAVTFVSAGLSGMLEEDWQRFMEIVSILVLLTAVLAGSYAAAMLSFMA